MPPPSLSEKNKMENFIKGLLSEPLPSANTVNATGLLGGDMSGVYNTKLSPDDEREYLAWALRNPQLGNSYDYDARGFWKSGAGTSENGHGGDFWKKPNHPTFSTQSQYSGVDGYSGGSWNQDGASWTYTPSETNIKNMSLADLKRYFEKVEPGNVLFSPWQQK